MMLSRELRCSPLLIKVKVTL